MFGSNVYEGIKVARQEGYKEGIDDVLIAIDDIIENNDDVLPEFTADEIKVIGKMYKKLTTKFDNN